jgi:hypothetical protein
VPKKPTTPQPQGFALMSGPLQRSERISNRKRTGLAYPTIPYQSHDHMYKNYTSCYFLFIRIFTQNESCASDVESTTYGLRRPRDAWRCLNHF